MPWRVIVLGEKRHGDIALETLVTDLSAPSRIANTSWIKPGPRVVVLGGRIPTGRKRRILFNESPTSPRKWAGNITLFDCRLVEPV